MSLTSEFLLLGLEYIEEHGHFPNVVRINIIDKNVKVVAVRNNYSGRVYLARNEYREKEIEESYAARYRQHWHHLLGDIEDCY